MKKIIIVAITLLALTSCENKNVTTYTTDYQINNCTLEIYIIDSCEYLGRVQNSNADKLTHK